MLAFGSDHLDSGKRPTVCQIHSLPLMIHPDIKHVSMQDLKRHWRIATWI
jgi:hypothetical protein